MINKNDTLLVVSAHAGDFVWRGGGTIAKYVNAGAKVELVILSYGARGESKDLWKIEEQTLDNVKLTRDAEISNACSHLGIKKYEIWDFKDYLMKVNEERMTKLVRKIREVQPNIILTHAPKDAFNPDHELVSKYVHEASVLATSKGVQDEGYPNITQAKLFGFEHHQSEISDFKPELIIDITDTYKQKQLAMNEFKAQQHLIEYYEAKALLRGNHARRCSGNQEYKQAEAFMRFFPYVGGEFV